VALLYFVLCWLLSLLSRRLEQQRLGRADRRTVALVAR
jgi:ABC-type amino acid transport system permease subunit